MTGRGIEMFVGFDIGGTTARASLYDGEWNRLAHVRRGVRKATEPGEVADLVVALLEALEGELDGRDAELTGLGVGLAAQLSADRRVVRNSPNLGWRDEPFADRLETTLEGAVGELDVHLVNDLDASLYGEHTAGAIDDVDDALAVYVGTGVGGAILSDRTLVTGADGVAGEIGHSKIEPGGRLCGCGERGCVEAYAGGIHLERQVARVAEQGDLPGVVADDTGTERDVDMGAADRRAAEGGPLGEIWERATDGLAVVVANACTLLNPAAVLVGGGVIEHCSYFREQFLTKLSPLVLEAARAGLEIRRPALGDEAGMLGAARLAAVALD